MGIVIFAEGAEVGGAQGGLPILTMLIIAVVVIAVVIGVLLALRRRGRLKVSESGYRRKEDGDGRDDVDEDTVSEADTIKYIPVLHCLSGEYEGAMIPLDKKVVLGRDPSIASVVLHSIEISRSHMSIDYQSATGTFLINDLDSKNGVYVARGEEKQFKKVKTTVLREGDRFIVGLRVAEFEVIKQPLDNNQVLKNNS